MGMAQNLKRLMEIGLVKNGPWPALVSGQWKSWPGFARRTNPSAAEHQAKELDL
jgi:hypothetical protein